VTYVVALHHASQDEVDEHRGADDRVDHTEHQAKQQSNGVGLQAKGQHGQDLGMRGLQVVRVDV
jgi:hypothetical protein